MFIKHLLGGKAGVVAKCLRSNFVPSFTSFVTLDKVLNLFKPQFPYQLMDKIVLSS